MDVEHDAQLPEGTVTFLFTDVEGSTKLFERHADAYSAALLRHDAVLRAAVEDEGGHVFETVGDAFYAVFAAPADAVCAALRAQIDLGAEQWGELGALRIRVGLHTGAVERRGRHYFGHTLYRCARIMATAHGGQVVLSSVTADLVRDALPDGASVRSLGVHRLKDIGEPEQIFELVHPALRSDLPPLRSLNTLLNNLPQQLSTFVGREREIEEVRTLIGRSRLVTLLGVGGSGKTRLALRVASEVLDLYPDGVWFVDLSSIRDPALVPQQVASVLAVREEPGVPVAAAVEAHLRSKRLLLILDNCEHLIQSSALLADALLRGCPHLRILATSREVLRIGGEAAWRVPPLSLPAAGGTNEDLLASEAVRLFAERAASAVPDFDVAGKAAVIVEICRRVDGIPLAIELAAARVRSLSVDQIATRLEQRFALLTGGSRAALPRQRTLRALVDWSYELLSPPERALFDRLSVFAGGWTLDAAEAICGCDGIEPTEVIDLLAGLVDKSLVVAETDAPGLVRYRLLETLREYGRERLAEQGGVPAIHRGHAEVFLALAEQAEPELTGAHQIDWLHRLDLELDNLRAAVRWSIDSRDAVIAQRLGGALYRFWSRRGLFTEGRDTMDQALALESLDAERATRSARAKALHGAATLAVQQGELDTARTLYERSLAIKRELGDRSAIAATLNNLAVIARYQADHATAQTLSEESLALYRDLGDKWAIAMLLANLGNVARDSGDSARARDLFAESLAVRRGLGDKWGIANSLENLGHSYLDRGEHEDARRSYAESLALARELGEQRQIAFLLEDFGALAAAEGSASRALELVAAATALRGRIGAPLPPAERTRLETFIARARDALSPEARATAETAGYALSVDDAVAMALAGPLISLDIRSEAPAAG